MSFVDEAGRIARHLLRSSWLVLQLLRSAHASLFHSQLVPPDWSHTLEKNWKYLGCCRVMIIAMNMGKASYQCEELWNTFHNRLAEAQPRATPGGPLEEQHPSSYSVNACINPIYKSLYCGMLISLWQQIREPRNLPSPHCTSLSG